MGFQDLTPQQRADLATHVILQEAWAALVGVRGGTDPITKSLSQQADKLWDKLWPQFGKDLMVRLDEAEASIQGERERRQEITRQQALEALEARDG